MTTLETPETPAPEVPIHNSDEFIQHFAMGAIKTIKDLCNTVARFERVDEGTDRTNVSPEIAGIIGITGKAFEGAMSILFPKSVFLLLMNRMLGESYAEIPPELADGAAELSNIIFGHAKVGLNAAGHDIRMSLPTVLLGTDIQSRAQAMKDAVTIILETEAGLIAIEIAGRVKKQEAPATFKAGGTNSQVPKLDASVMLEFIEGTRKTLNTLCKAIPVAERPFMKDGTKTYNFEIGGMIGVTGAAFGGNFSICFELAVFMKVLEGMFGEPVTKIEPGMDDAAAEIVNMVFGVVKQVLNGKGYALQMAIPTIISGKGLQSLYPARKPPIVIPFQLYDGHFWVEFAFDEEKANRKK